MSHPSHPPWFDQRRKYTLRIPLLVCSLFYDDFQ
jgi:hypothetical protein